MIKIIKLGGSLSKSSALSACLNSIVASKLSKLIIVPGGGDFADKVRDAQRVWRFNELIAHSMAILAMQQMALLFKGLQPSFYLVDSVAAIKQQLSSPLPMIWSPAINELEQAKIPASWDVTSDSLAAWLATQLKADELVLVKSALITTQDFKQLTQQGIIDAHFGALVEFAEFTVQIQHYHDFCRNFSV
jgi:aspartokinase-like uncharacterized kinase